MMSQPSALSRASAFLRSCLCWDRHFTRNVLFVALPMILQQLVSASLHIIDGLMVSGLGDAAYSAVTQANRFTFVFQLFIFGTSSGCGIYLSQYWGARDIRRMRHTMGLGLGAALLITVVFSGAGLLFPRQIISCFLQPGESFELAVQYLRIVAPGYLLFAIDNVYAISLKASEKTYLPMLSGFASIVVNTVLNYALINGAWGFPKLGVQGAAIATVMASAVSLGMNLTFAYAKKLPAGARFSEMLCRDKAFVRGFVKMVLPVILNEGLWGLGTTMYSVFYGRMGDVNIAAMGVCNTVNDLVWVVIFAMMNATGIIVGKALGSGDRDRAYLYAKRMMAGAVASGLVLGVVLFFIRAPLTGIFSGLSQAARDKAQLVLLFGAASMWFRAINCINVVGVLRSGGDTMYSLVLDVGTMWFIGVPTVGIAALVLHWPLEYVYCCTLIEEVVKAVIGLPHFTKKKWMNVLTESKGVDLLGNS